MTDALTFAAKCDADTLAHAFGSAARSFGDGHRFHWLLIDGCRRLKQASVSELQPELLQTLRYFSAVLLGLQAAGFVTFQNGALKLAREYAPSLE